MVLSPAEHSPAPCWEEGQEHHSADTLVGLKRGGGLPGTLPACVSLLGWSPQRATDWGVLTTKEGCALQVRKPEVHDQGAAGLIPSGGSRENPFPHLSGLLGLLACRYLTGSLPPTAPPPWPFPACLCPDLPLKPIAVTPDQGHPNDLIFNVITSVKTLPPNAVTF